jgi:hypothetical protein
MADFHVVMSAYVGRDRYIDLDAVITVGPETTRRDLFTDVKRVLVEELASKGVYTRDLIVMFFSAEPNELPVTVEREVA